MPPPYRRSTEVERHREELLRNDEPLHLPECPVGCPIEELIARQNSMRVIIASEIERTRALEHWQEAQNGTLQRLESKVDKLIFWVIAFGGTSLIAMAGFIITLLSQHKL